MVFNYLNCPQCKQRIDAPFNKDIRELMKKDLALEDIVVKKCMERAKFEDLHKNPRLKTVGDRFYNDLEGFALYKLSYY